MNGNPLIKHSKSHRELLAFLFLVFPILFFAQSTTETDSIVPLPQALTTSEIADYAQKTRQLTTDVRTLMEKSENLISIKEELRGYDSVLVDHLKLLRDSLVNISLDQLDKLENELGIYRDKTTPWIDDLDKWRFQTDQYEKDINFDIETWRLTGDSIQSNVKSIKDKQSSLAVTLNKVSEQVINSQKRIANLEEEFVKWNSELLGTENAITITLGEINDATELTASKRQKFFDDIWIPEYPPIWKAQPKIINEQNKKSLGEVITQKLNLIKRYNKDNSEFYYSLLFSFILLFGLIMYMKKRVGQLFHLHPEIKVDDNVVLNNPLISSLVILTYLVFLMFDIPDQIKYIVFFFAIFPFSFLLWQLKSHLKKTYLFLFILFSLIFIYISVFSEVIKELRYTMLLINGLVIYVLLKLRKNEETIKAENSYWLGTLPGLIPVFIFLSTAAIISDIIGSVQLSLVITRTVIGTFLIYIVIKESVKLIQSFIYLLIIGPLYKISLIVQEDSDLLLKWLEKYLKIGSYFFWIYIVLGLLKIRDSFINPIIDFITTPLEIGEISISLGNVLAFYLILQISTWLSQFIRYILKKEVFPRTHTDKGVASTITLMIRYTLAFLGFLLALAGAGVSLNQVVIGVSALGIGIGFGLQNIVNNFVSGIILALERPITIGDVVKVDEIEGVVKDIGIRASQIRTWDGADVLVPNGYLISGKLVNWTLVDRSKRLNVEVRLPLNADIPKASKVILGAAASISDLAKEPAPAINYEGVIDGTSVIKVYAWIDDRSKGWSAGTALKIAINDSLKKEGFNISIPILDVQLNQKSIQ